MQVKRCPLTLNFILILVSGTKVSIAPSFFSCSFSSPIGRLSISSTYLLEEAMMLKKEAEVIFGKNTDGLR